MPSSIDLAARLSSVVALQQEVLAAASDLDEVTAMIVRHTPELTNSDGAAFELLDGEDLVVTASAGLAALPVGSRAPVIGSVAADALRRGAVVSCDDLRIESVRPGIPIHSSITAPMLRDGQVIGVLESYADRSAAFSDLDAYTLQLLSGIASASMMIARAFHDRRISEERYRMLFERNVAGVFRTTREGKILDCNDAFAGTLGYTNRDEVLQLQSWDLYHERGDRENFLAQLNRSQSLMNLKLPLRKKDGSQLNGLVNVSMIPGETDDWQLLGTLVEA